MTGDVVDRVDGFLHVTRGSFVRQMSSALTVHDLRTLDPISRVEPTVSGSTSWATWRRSRPRTGPPSRGTAVPRSSATTARSSAGWRPDVARLLAPKHELVLGDPDDALVAELRALGADVDVVTQTRDLVVPGAVDRLVDAAASPSPAAS